VQVLEELVEVVKVVSWECDLLLLGPMASEGAAALAVRVKPGPVVATAL
jgi:hypothetical protein